MTLQIVKIKNEIEKLICVTFPELHTQCDIYCNGVLNLLKLYPSAARIASLTDSEVAQLLRPHRGRKVGISPQRLISLAKSSIGCDDPERERILSGKISLLFLLQEQLDALSSLLIDRCRDAFPTQLRILTSIKGVGPITAAHFLAEVGDIRRFESHKKLIAYAGLDPCVYQSGKFDGRGGISKRGNRHLRRVIWLMAVGVARYSPFFREYFLRRRKEGLPYKKAILATAHKLIRVIFAMLSNETYFSEHGGVTVNSL